MRNHAGDNIGKKIALVLRIINSKLAHLTYKDVIFLVDMFKLHVLHFQLLISGWLVNEDE